MDISLVTHLLVDIHDQHYFFSLFLLYIKNNFDKLCHIRLIIFSRNQKQTHALCDYFAPEMVNTLDWVNFYENIVPETLTQQSIELVNVQHLFLEDIEDDLAFRNDGGFNTTTTTTTTAGMYCE